MKNRSEETINEMNDDSGREDNENQAHEKDEQVDSHNKNDTSDSSTNKRKVSIQVPVSFEIPKDDNESEPHHRHSKERVIEITKDGDLKYGSDEKEDRHETYHEQSHRKSLERGNLQIRKRECRSTSPHQRRKSTLADLGIITNTGGGSCNPTHQQLLRIQPAIPANANIRNILENVSRSG